MSEPKVRKLKEKAVEDRNALRTAEMAHDATIELKSIPSPVPLVTSVSALPPVGPVDIIPPAPIKRSKTGLGTQKKRKHIKVEQEDEFEGTLGKRYSSREPKAWKEVLSTIEQARAGFTAPVDEVGAESLGDWDEVKAGTLPARDARFRTLLALMLSSQTKDAVTAAAMVNLRKRFPPLSVGSMLNATEEEIDACINKVGFHNRKSIFIKKVVAILHEQYDDDVPDTIKTITDLPGVGPKMAFLLMQIAWNRVIGIGVDTHVHRISNRLGWVSTKSPEETREALQAWLPSEHWGTINQTLVGYGQVICVPIGPKCPQCPVSHLCPSSTVPRSVKREKTL